MSNTINMLAHYYKGKDDETDYSQGCVTVKSDLLEEALVGICDNLAKVENITGRKNIDVEYLLNIVGSYLLGIQDGSLDEDTTEPPSKLFEVSLFPALENTDNTVTKEIDNDSTDDSGDPEGVDTE